MAYIRTGLDYKALYLYGLYNSSPESLLEILFSHLNLKRSTLRERLLLGWVVPLSSLMMWLATVQTELGMCRIRFERRAFAVYQSQPPPLHIF